MWAHERLWTQHNSASCPRLMNHVLMYPNLDGEMPMSGFHVLMVTTLVV